MTSVALSRFDEVDVAALAKDDLEVSTITLYQRELALHRGAQVAVTSEYICYAIKGGMIRIINRLDASRALLRGLEKVSDMAFAPSAPEGDDLEEEEEDVVLAAVGSEGGLRVWSLESSDGSLEPAELLKQDVGTPTARADVCDRVAWRPGSAEAQGSARLLATVLGDGENMILWAVRLGVVGQEPAFTLLNVNAAPGTDAAARSIAFTPEGGALVVALASQVSVFDIRTVTAGAILAGTAAAPAAVSVLSLSGADVPLESVTPLAPGVLLVGSQGNRRLSLWEQAGDGGHYAPASRLDIKVTATDGSADGCLMPIHLATCSVPPMVGSQAGESAAPPLILACDWRAGCLVTIRVRCPEPSPGGPLARFACARAFSAAGPVLSLEAAVEVNEEGAAADGSGGQGGTAPEVSVFVVQTNAVQRLAFRDAQLVDESKDEEAAGAVAPPAPVHLPGAAGGPGSGQVGLGNGQVEPPASTPSPFLHAALKRLASGGVAAAPAAEAPEHSPGRGTSSPSPPTVAPATGLGSVASSAGGSALAQTLGDLGSLSEAHFGTLMSALQQLLDAHRRTEASHAAAMERMRQQILAEVGAAEERQQERSKEHLAHLEQRLLAKGTSAVDAGVAALVSRLASQLPAIVEAAVERTVPLTAEALVPQVQAAVEATRGASPQEVTDALTAAVRSHLSSALVPAVEAAVAQVGAQLGERVKQAASAAAATAGSAARDACTAQVGASVNPIAELVSAALAGSLGQAVRPQVDASLEATLAPLAADVASLRRAVEHLDVVGAGGGGVDGGGVSTASSVASFGGGGGGAASAGAGVQPARDLVAEAGAEVDNLIAQGYLEKAFATALSANSIVVLNRACSAVEPAALVAARDHGASTLQSKQIVLISLIQQLADQLTAPDPLPHPSGNRWPEPQAEWLAECLLALQPAEPVIAHTVPAVLATLVANLERTIAAPQLIGRDDVRRQLQMALHVARSHQRM